MKKIVIIGKLGNIKTQNILSLKIETRIGVAIVSIAVIIFLVTVLKSLDDFKEFTNKNDLEMSQQNKVYIQK